MGAHSGCPMSRDFCETWAWVTRFGGWPGGSKSPLLAKDARNGAPLLEECLQFPPQVLEIVEALFPHQPLRGAHGPFGEAAAGFGVVAEIDPVGRGFEHDLMQADDLAFAEGCDLEVFMTTGFADDALDGDSRARRRIFFLDVMALENLTGIIVAQGGGGGAGDVEEEIHAYGKIRAIDESGALLRDQGADTIDFRVPAGCAHDHILASFQAGFDVGEDAVRSGEVDNGVDVAEVFRRECSAGDVLFGAGDADVMLAFGGNFRCERSRFSAAEDKKVHAEVLQGFNHRGQSGAQGRRSSR